MDPLYKTKLNNVMSKFEGLLGNIIVVFIIVVLVISIIWRLFNLFFGEGLKTSGSPGMREEFYLNDIR